MNLLRLSSLFLAPALAASFALACGEITDPTQNGERTATVSGALSGTAVPAGARVAVVWRNGTSGGVAVGAEADIIGGKFTMNLTVPPDGYFFPMEGNDYDSLNGPNTVEARPSPPPEDESGPTSGSSGTDPGGTGSTSSSGGTSGSTKVVQKMGTRTNVSGGITESLSVAVAGFIVYVDANGNGKLDLEGEYASSPDTILGGNKELLLTYLKGGGQLDYEKLRDKSGILPNAGFNLAWDEGRWLPLNLVELKITENAKLSSAVCSGESGGYGGGEEESTPGYNPETQSSGGTGGSTGSRYPSGGTYPAPDDPALTCVDNGHKFTYGTCPPAPVGLCASEYPPPCARSIHGFTTETGEPPEGWPCPITGPSSGDWGTGCSGSTSSSSGSTPIPTSDAGPAPDAGGS
jgi:hypothetical protein